MNAFAWVVVAFLGWLSVVGFVLLLVRGGAEADRIERRWVAPRPERWESSAPVDAAVVRALLDHERKAGDPR